MFNDVILTLAIVAGVFDAPILPTSLPANHNDRSVLIALGDSTTRGLASSTGCIGGYLMNGLELSRWLNVYQQITGSVGFPRRGPACGGKAWVDQLATLLQSDGPVEVINAASDGATLEAAEIYETRAVPGDATVVVISEGTPDEMRIIDGKEPASTFAVGFRELIQIVQTRAPKARIFVSLMPDLSRLPVMPADTGPNPVTAQNPKNVADGTVARYLQLHAQLNAIIRSLGVTIVDPYCSADFYQDVSSDEFHPNDKGHSIIARSFFAAIHAQKPQCDSP